VVSTLPILFGSKACGSETNLTYQDEEKNQLRTRIKIEGTIDRAVFEDFKEILRLELKDARETDRAEPSVSHVLEMLLRKGIKAYKTEKRKAHVDTKP